MKQKKKDGANAYQIGLASILRSYSKKLCSERKREFCDIYKELCSIVHSGDLDADYRNYYKDEQHIYDEAVNKYLLYSDRKLGVLKNDEIQLLSPERRSRSPRRSSRSPRRSSRSPRRTTRRSPGRSPRKYHRRSPQKSESDVSSNWRL